MGLTDRLLGRNDGVATWSWYDGLLAMRVVPGIETNCGDLPVGKPWLTPDGFRPDIICGVSVTAGSPAEDDVRPDAVVVQQ